ncbi:hypothetical protein JTB14_026738 [Gonioctena quinquepunctata]|nr:hypothetical protein JTB14_026738 [Gonioctena quinquepunctata]
MTFGKIVDMRATALIEKVLLLLIFHDTLALFDSALKKLREKASSIYKSKRKGKALNFLGQDVTEFPGTNPKLLGINEAKWGEYYACLKSQNDSLGKYLTVIPEAVLGFEGSNIKFNCKICLNPEERHKVDSVIWEWAPMNGKKLVPVEFTENIFESPEDKTLHLYNLQREHSGQYVCSLGESLTAPYFLTVVDIGESEAVEVHNSEAPLGPYPKASEVIQGYNLILDTDWSEWSKCSDCGKVGRRNKLGYCIIYSKDKQKLSIGSNSSNITESASDDITNVDLELFGVFQFGIPCNSHILPQAIRNLPQVISRQNEIMVGYCRIKCPVNEVFEIKDKNGNVIEKANNSAGIYSILQPLPPMEPTVERQLFYGVKGKTIVLSCPGNLNTDAPIQWQIGNKNVVPEILSEESQGRIFISITDRIHIKNARISDSNIYSCWQLKELAGTVRLIVEKKTEFTFSHHMMLAGIAIILFFFLHVCVKAFFGRKYAKTF